MLPPSPAATIAFKSPNACNLCHSDKDAAWADRYVREWRGRDYQAPVLHRAGLIDAARKRDWTRLPEMLAYLESKDHDPVFATSLIRLLMPCQNPSKWPVILKAMKDPSPLVRGAAAESLAVMPSMDAFQTLIDATGDDYRLVRVRAAMALTSFQGIPIREGDLDAVKKATGEYLDSMISRPDQWSSHYNLGNYFLNRGDLPLALEAYETALRLEPRAVMPMVNISIAYAQKGEEAKAEESLRKALEIEPTNSAANFNMGLLKAEQKDLAEAEQYLRAALKADPTMAEAAYNLGVLVATDRIDEAIRLLQIATELRSGQPKYAYTLAFYQNQKGDTDGAISVLRGVIERQPAYGDAYLLLGEICEKQGKQKEAEALLRQALDREDLLRQDRYRLEAKLQELSSTGAGK
jgi:tetratricopeptide (TPR) repeat protein